MLSKQLIRIAYANNRSYAEAGLWFLPTLFVAECVFYLICVAGKKWGERVGYTDLLLGTACGALGGAMSHVMLRTPLQRTGWPFSLDIALTAVFFITVGAQCKPLLGKLIEGGKTARGRGVMAGAAALLFAAVFAISQRNLRFLFDHRYERVVMARASYGLYPLFLLGALLGTAGILLLSPSLTKLRALRYIGHNSLLYMCLNHLMIALTTAVIGKMIPIETLHGPVRILMVMIVLAAVTLCCTMMTWVINRFVPVLSGKS